MTTEIISSPEVEYTTLENIQERFAVTRGFIVNKSQHVAMFNTTAEKHDELLETSETSMGGKS